MKRTARWIVAPAAALAALAGCTSTPGPTKSFRAQFPSAQAAVKHDCRASWVDVFHDRRQTDIRWTATSSQYETGSGYVARVKRSGAGFRVIKCRWGGFSHG